jgi:hypothetical protein
MDIEILRQLDLRLFTFDRSIMPLLHEKFTCPGCSDFRNHLRGCIY